MFFLFCRRSESWSCISMRPTTSGSNLGKKNRRSTAFVQHSSTFLFFFLFKVQNLPFHRSVVSDTSSSLPHFLPGDSFPAVAASLGRFHAAGAVRHEREISNGGRKKLGWYSETGFHIGMDRNFVCLCRKHNCNWSLPFCADLLIYEINYWVFKQF